MAQAVSRRPLTAGARVRSRVSSCGIYGGQSGIGTVFSPEYFGFPMLISFHRCSITFKNEKNLSSFITELHNKPQGCGASVASAAGPFTTKYFCSYWKPFSGLLSRICYKDGRSDTELSHSFGADVKSASGCTPKYPTRPAYHQSRDVI